MMHDKKFGRCATVMLLASFAVTGCGTGMMGRPVAPDYCATAQPIFVGRDDVISDATAREILEHNKTGQKLCGWGRKK
jgi:hypothetical protein